MASTAFPEVRDFQPDAPTLPASLNKFLWSSLFTLDYTVGLTTKPDGEGDVIRKTAYPGMTGRAYNRLYDRMYDEVHRRFGSRRRDPTPVPSIDGSTWDSARFAQWRRGVAQPLVLRGFLKDARAVQEWSKEWFVDHLGSEMVRCLNMDASPQKRGKSLVGENVSLEDVSLRDFLLEDRYAGLYLNNFDGVLTDQDFDEYCDGQRVDRLRGDPRVLTHWFISRSFGNGTPLHSANGDNLFLNIKGRKEWHFFHPALSPVMLPALSKYGMYAVSEIGFFSSEDYEARYREFPHLAALPKMSVVLEEGDVLYNPPWWWHNVRNLTPFTVGCATRFAAHPTNLGRAPQFHLCQLIDIAKHPRRSFLTRSLAVRYFGGDRKAYIDSTFSRKKD